MKIPSIEITNPDKIIFPDDGITKMDVIDYYLDVASLILPQLQNRPISVIRCHEGIDGEKFFKKHPSTEGKDIGTLKIDGEDYFCVKNLKNLLMQVQMGTIEFHTWGCKAPSIEKPDSMVFDLDPDEKLSIATLRCGVKNLKSVLDELGLESDLKTSGGKGYHIVVKFSKNKNWQEFGDFAEKIAQILQEKWPKLFTTNMRKDSRHGKIFVDYLRNRRGASCVAAYSLRARPTAPISFPISWDDLDKIRPNQITIKNYKKYLKNTKNI